MSNTKTQGKIKKETWEAYQAALQNLLSESLPDPSEEADSSKLPEEELKRVVTEAVGAVLLQGSLLEKCLLKSLHGLSAEEKQKLGSQLVSDEALQQQCQRAFRSLTLQTLVPAFSKQIQETVNKQVLEFGKTEEFKDLIDSRFRVMEQYLRSEVIPKVIDQHLERT